MNTPAPNMPFAAWFPLQTAAAGFRDECSALEQLVQELFADIDHLRAQLESQADELEEGRQHLAERGREVACQRKETARLTHVLEQQESQLNDALSELRALRAEFAHEQTEARLREEAVRSQMQQQLTSLELERDQLRLALQSSSNEPQAKEASEEGLLLLSRQFAQLQQQMEVGQSGIAEIVEQAAQRAVATLPALTGDAVSADSHELSGQLREMERERLELESELDLVRARSAELQETVLQQKRELAEQRTDLSEELRELRRLAEAQSELLAQREYSAAAPREEQRPSRISTPLAPTLPPATVSEDSPPADPVVSSVMAQFAKLQKDVAQRRKKK